MNLFLLNSISDTANYIKDIKYVPNFIVSGLPYKPLKTEQNMQCPRCSKNIPYHKMSSIRFPSELSSDKSKVISGYHLASQMLERTGVSQLSKFMNLGYIADHNPQQAVITPEKDRLNQNSENCCLK